MRANRVTSGDVSLMSVLGMLRRRRRYVIASAVVVSAAFAALALYLPDRYRARVLIAAEPAVSESYVREAPGRTALNVQAQLRAVRESLMSRPVLEDVIEEFGLYESAGGQVPERALEDVKSRIQIQVESEYHFHVGFDGPDRAQVMDVANRLGALFIERASRVRGRRAEDQIRFLEEELEGLRAELAEKDERIREYRTRFADELPDRIEANLGLLQTLEEQVQELATEISDAEAERAAILGEIEDLEERGALAIQEPAELVERRERLDELRSRYTGNHPEIVRVEREIQDLEREVGNGTSDIERQRSPLYSGYAELRARLEGVERRLQSRRDERRELASRAALHRRRVEAVPEHERTLAQLNRDYEMTLAQYQALIDRQQEAQLASRLEEAQKGLVFTIVEPASLPSSPHSPKRARLVLMGILAGLGLGLVAAFAVEQLDTSFREPEDVQSHTGLPVLASVPSVPSAGRGKHDSEDDSGGAEIVVLSRPRSVAAEQYRYLAVRIRELPRQGPLLLGLTSAVGGEGKTTTAINLAVELAREAEGKVLLIDADLRKPRLRKLLQLKPGPGLRELIERPDDELERYVVRMDGLYVMPSNPAMEDTVKILGSPASRTVFHRLRETFELVVLDLPPVLPVADSHVVAGLSDGLLLVVRARQTGRELVERALDSLEGAKKFGVVLNDVDLTHSRYAYAYRYYQKHYLAG